MSVKVERLGLIISSDLQPGAGDNINGPCCIEVPPWCPGRLGRFYLYFADHAGEYIKFAFAEEIKGPWTLRAGGVLDLSGFVNAYDHIASPEIFIDHRAKELRLYFHARSHAHGREQWTFAASSSDGLHFRPAADQALAAFYLKIFPYRGQLYGMSKGGNLWRSANGLSPFEAGGNPFDRSLSKELWHNESGSIRHVGLSLNGTSLNVYFSRIGDAPERILRCCIDLADPNWENWAASPPKEVLRPEESYEGADLPFTVSLSGPANGPKNALRDPHILTFLGENYMFYSVCGEQGIAVGRLYKTN